MAAMLAVRYLYILALVVWLGGMVVAGAVVAPATFSVLESWDAGTGRMLAGRVFGVVLSRFHVVAYAAGVLMLLTLTLQKLLGPRPAAFGFRAGLLTAMLAITLYSGFVVVPQVETLQNAVSGPINRLPPDDPRRREFDGLHVFGSRLLTATAVAGLVLLLWEAREST
jgi:uncharacterized membrane protein